MPLYLSRRFHDESLRYLAIYEAVKCSASLADMICRTYRSHRRVSDITIEGAIRKAAKSNPEQCRALLALLEPSRPQSMLTMALSCASAGGDTDHLTQGEAQADEEYAEWEDSN